MAGDPFKGQVKPIPAGKQAEAQKRFRELANQFRQGQLDQAQYEQATIALHEELVGQDGGGGGNPPHQASGVPPDAGVGGAAGAAQFGPVDTRQRPTGMEGSTPSTSDEDSFLFGPTSRPFESPLVGSTASGPAPPPNVPAWLPAIQAAAKDPNAPANVRELIYLVNHFLGV